MPPPVAFVGGAVGSIATAGTTLTVTYTPTAGNTVVAGIRFSAANSGLTCKDNNNHSLTALTNPGGFRMFHTVAQAGATSFVFTWTSSVTASAFVGEYSGIFGTVGSGTSGSGSSTTPTRTVTTTHQNSFLIAGFGDLVNTTFTALTGNLRESTNDTVNTSVALVDNTSASPGSVTDAVTGALTGSWLAIAWEVFPVQPVASGASFSKTVILTDDNGFFPIGTFGSAPIGTFLGQPTPIVSTDPTGLSAGTFAGIPQVVKSVSTIQGTYTDGNGNEVAAPIPVAQTDITGTSLWSSTYIGTPVAMNLN